MQIRFQVNLLVRRDEAFPPLANLQQNMTVLPIFWAQEGYDTVPDSTLTMMEIAILAPSLAAGGLIFISLLFGAMLVAAAAINYRRRRRNKLPPLDTYYNTNKTQYFTEYVLPTNQRHKKYSFYKEDSRKSSSDNTDTTVSLINNSKQSSKFEISTSTSINSLSSAKKYAASDTSASPV